MHSETSLSGLVTATVCGAQKLTHCAGKANTHICRPVVQVMLFTPIESIFLCDTVHFVEFRPITQIEMKTNDAVRKMFRLLWRKPLKLMTTKVELSAPFSAGRTKDCMFGNGFCIAQNKQPFFQKG